MRVLLRLIALVTFALSLTVSIAATWSSTHLYDETGFVDMTSAIGNNEQVRATVINVASVQLAEQASLPAGLSARVASATAEVLSDVTSTPAFAEAWRESMRRSHHVQFFSANPPPHLTIDVAPFVDLALSQSTILETLGAQGPEELLVQLSSVDPTRFVSVVALAEDYRLPAYALTLISGVLAFLASKRRRLGTGLATLGTVTIAVSLLSALTVRAGTHRLSDELLAENRDYAGFIRPLGEAAIESYDALLVPVAASGLILAALGIVWRAISPHQR